MTDGAVLGVFAKWPTPGQVKTRLAQATSPEWAARVADAFLRDSLARLSTVAARRVVVFAPQDAESAFAALSGGFVRLPQGEGDLGERLSRFFAWALASGAEAVVAVGSDSPSLPVVHVEAALAALRDRDVVLGPATDGGYYLIGSRLSVPVIFQDVSWSSSRVLAQTVQQIRRAGLSLTLLPPWYDVDTLDDWQMLRGHLDALRAAGEVVDLPHTLALLAEE